MAGGAGTSFGGGGAGGALQLTLNEVVAKGAWAVTVGAGGGRATNGSNSVFQLSGASANTAIGGGKGGVNYAGQSGGSGGGGAAWSGSATSPGAGTSNQGNAGGNGAGWLTSGVPNTAVNGTYIGGGGGGAGGAGGNFSGNTGGAGGAGLNWKSLGTYYGGGGGGASRHAYNEGDYARGGAGGSGGGGPGAFVNDGTSNDGTGVSAGSGTNAAANCPAITGAANTGGGGGGYAFGWHQGPAQIQAAVATGGSGVIVIRYSGGQVGTGGTVTSAGGYTYHTFTSSGTYIS
tara:strand:- start:207 stop:1073 length:867 start_codon:yes stop_codon:yes gene_type:complete